LPEHPKLQHTQADLRDAAARKALAGVDVLWHLGFQLWRDRRNANAMAEVNLTGTENVLGARPSRIVLASSAAVYGAWPDNPLPLTEDSPPRPNAECCYARQKLDVEALCESAAPTVTLRLAAVLGPHADPHLLRAARGYRWMVPALPGVNQALQFLDEDDAAAALHQLADAPPGVINVAPPDRMSAEEIAAVAGGRVVRISRPAAFGLAELLWRVGLTPFGIDRAVFLSGPLALSCARAQVLGWTARSNSWTTLRTILKP
jgi:nucleoside-diphosphate-sugar epimerase